MSSFESRALNIAVTELLKLAPVVPNGVIAGCLFAGALEGYFTGKPHSMSSAAKSGLSIVLFSACTSGTSVGPENKVGAHIMGRALDGIALLKNMSFKARADNTPGAGSALAMLVLLSMGSYIGAEIRKQQKESGCRDLLE